MMEDELVQGAFPDLDVDAMERVSLLHDAGDDVWIAGHGGVTGHEETKADALEALAVKLRQNQE